MYVKLELVPLQIPDVVYIKQKPGLRQDGIKANVQSIPIKDLDVETLTGLVEEFRAGLFAKAGIVFQNPRIVGSNSIENRGD